MLKVTSIILLISSILVGLTSANFSALPPLPDWDDVWDAILAKDIAKL